MRGKAPAKATTPRLTSGSAKVALRLATTRSQLTISSVPPPKAIPFTAAMIGFRPVRLEIAPKPEGGIVVLLRPLEFEVFHSEDWSALKQRTAPAQKAHGIKLRVAVHVDAIQLFWPVQSHEQYAGGWIRDDAILCRRLRFVELWLKIYGRHDDWHMASLPRRYGMLNAIDLLETRGNDMSNLASTRKECLTMQWL
ncbi:hypothetical protein KC338_g65 [Hortaea werneckii]|nr:hypothetical protein KC338_g65 [Hortaea werneckii]